MDDQQEQERLDVAEGVARLERRVVERREQSQSDIAQEFARLWGFSLGALENDIGALQSATPPIDEPEVLGAQELLSEILQATASERERFAQATEPEALGPEATDG
jgi:hypothetical protein